MPLAPNTRLGRYEILSQLGAGGMGEVYRATDPVLGRDVLEALGSLVEKSLVRQREQGDGEGRFSMLEVVRMSGDLEAASDYYEQALAAAGRHVRSQPNAIPLANLGGLSLEEGDHAAASGYYRESLAVVAELENSLWAAVERDGLAAVALDAGELEEAARLAGAAEAQWEKAGAPLEAWE